MKHRYVLLPLALAALPSAASAAELTFDGHYRARGMVFDSLSLSDTNPRAEGTSVYFDHRLRLAPAFLISDHVGLFAQVDVLPYVIWGGDPVTGTDIVTGEDVPVTSSQAVEPPTTSDGAATLQNIKATRAWGEVYAPFGTFRFGRMPVEWGTGMVFNAGNDPEDEFGDTADRIQLTAPIGPVYVFGGFETPYEGLLGETDDVKALLAGVVYQTENTGIGIYNTYRWQSYEDDKFGAYIGDIWAETTIGPAHLELEFAAILGQGDLSTGANDVSITSFGGHLAAGYDTETYRAGFDFGFAGGDGDVEDSKIHTFSFDPDYNVGLLLFEEPMPTLESAVLSEANGGRDTDAVRTGYSVSNAIYIRPRIGYQLMDELTADLSLLSARAAKLPDDAETDRGYGNEFHLSLKYAPYQHFWLKGTGALLLPGPFFSQYEHPDLGGGFDQPTLGVQIVGAVEF